MRDFEKLRSELMRRAMTRTAGYNCSQDMADDVVQETLLAVWQRGKDWHEGRIVLELRNQIRRVRRKEATRAHLNLDIELVGDAA